MIGLGDVLASVKYQDKANPPLILGQNIAGVPREVYPVGTLFRLNEVEFKDNAGLGMMPYCRVFGGKVGYKSEILSGVLKSKLDGGVPSSCFRLLQQRFTGSVLFLYGTVVDPVPVDSAPSSFVMSCSRDFLRRVEVAFGSNGTSIMAYEAGAIVFQKTMQHTIKSNDRISVRRIKSLIEVYVNGGFVHSAQHSSLERVLSDGGYAGASTTQNGTIQSTGLLTLGYQASTDVNVSGGLSRVDAEKIVLPYNQWSTVAVIYIEYGGDVTVGLKDFTWQTTITSGDRKVAFDVNDASTGNVISDKNGGSLVVNGNLTDGAKLTIRAYSQQDPGQGRTLASGYLEVVPR